eukprot:TRINITY_DN282_c0_g1_i1.p1 TRINITY_DN282_c0_g1~~TRINITY_DN282_c0_g1_i1.p1  ORF type:complete len:269 (+),score=115.08 TRINITY_DN282_c0_g1_i1:762-1568(+)
MSNNLDLKQKFSLLRQEYVRLKGQYDELFQTYESLQNNHQTLEEDFNSFKLTNSNDDEKKEIIDSRLEQKEEEIQKLNEELSGIRTVYEAKIKERVDSLREFYDYKIEEQQRKSEADFDTQKTALNDKINALEEELFKLQNAEKEAAQRSVNIPSVDLAEGFLIKEGSLRKSLKRRFFRLTINRDEKLVVFNYFKEPEDTTPIGEIELAPSTFVYGVPEEKHQRRFTFEVDVDTSNPDSRIYVLAASSEVDLQYWLTMLDFALEAVSQ